MSTSVVTTAGGVGGVGGRGVVDASDALVRFPALVAVVEKTVAEEQSKAHVDALVESRMQAIAVARVARVLGIVESGLEGVADIQREVGMLPGSHNSWHARALAWWTLPGHNPICVCSIVGVPPSYRGGKMARHHAEEDGILRAVDHEVQTGGERCSSQVLVLAEQPTPGSDVKGLVAWNVGSQEGEPEAALAYALLNARKRFLEAEEAARIQGLNEKISPVLARFWARSANHDRFESLSEAKAAFDMICELRPEKTEGYSEDFDGWLEDFNKRTAEDALAAEYEAAYREYFSGLKAALLANRRLVDPFYRFDVLTGEASMPSLFRVEYVVHGRIEDGDDLETNEAMSLLPDPDSEGFWPVVKPGGAIVQTRYVNLVKVEQVTDPEQLRYYAVRIPLPFCSNPLSEEVLALRVSPIGAFDSVSAQIAALPWTPLPIRPEIPQAVPSGIADGIREMVHDSLHDSDSEELFG